MTHWLEEAERDEARKKQRSSRESAKIEDKIFRIQQNYEVNHVKYENFIQIMHDLFERANALPPVRREPWNIIDFKPRESKLNNHQYQASTNKPYDKTVAIKSFPFVKNQHYKHIHEVRFAVSKDMGMVEIEVKDDYVAKSRLRSDDSKDSDLLIDDGLKRVNIVFRYEIDKLDKELSLKILDFLAFKSDFKSLPFGEEHFKYSKRG